MIKQIALLLVFYSLLSTTTSLEKIGLVEFLDAMNGKEFVLETWGIYEEGFDHSAETIRENYNSLDKAFWIQKRDVKIQATGSNSTELIRFYADGYDGILISISVKKDSILIDYPTDLTNRSAMKIPKTIDSNGYNQEGISITVVSSNLIKISLSIQNDRVIHYWIDKKDGPVFMFSSSEFLNIIGIPK